MRGERKPKFDLEERLLDFAASIIKFAESMHKTDAGRHIAGQLIRSGTAPLGQQGEAVSAESPRDFVHKMKVGLKELRETHRWLKLAVRVPLTNDCSTADAIISETDELIRIFVASIRTAKSNALRNDKP